MSRLRRLRWWWRSLSLPLRPASLTTRPEEMQAAMGVLLEFQRRLEAGTWARTASTGTKDPGTRTPETATTEECSSYSPPGAASPARLALIASALPSSFTEPFSSGDATADRGASGAPQDSVA